MIIQRRNRARLVLFLFSLGLVLAGCGVSQSFDPVSLTATARTPAGIAGAKVAKAAGTSTVQPLRISLSADLPDEVRAPIVWWAKQHQAIIAPPGQKADLTISSAATQGAVPLQEMVYVAADSFYGKHRPTSSAELRSLWSGAAKTGSRIFTTDSTAKALTPMLGTPGAAVARVPLQDLPRTVSNAPDAIALVPFDQLAPQLVALSVDGKAVMQRDLQIKQYPLVTTYWVSGESGQAQAFVQAMRPQIAATNRDPQRLTTLIMTGVTAMARGTAWVIDRQGDPAYPARQIAQVLAAADITHISNEIPFVDDCQPSLEPDLLVLCSKPSYMAALKLAGTDIVGLTGNHMLDYGAQAFLKTLDLYDKEKIKYYAGGRNAAEAKRPLVIEDHGNRLAFLGANSFGPPSDWADETSPGSQEYDANAMKQEIDDARKKADLVLVEYQAEETYEYEPSYLNIKQFRATIADGADVVTGVQSHVAQAVEFGADGRHMILYGLGNLFFDQMYSDIVRQGLIVRHTIYAGRLLQTELLVTVLEHSAQPRWATPAEQATVLNGVFEASRSIAP